MRTVKIERERWRTPTSGTGGRLVLINDSNCGCIMGLIGEACGIGSGKMLGRGALRDDELEQVGIDCETQERAIEINDRTSISDEYREAKLKELFKDHLILEFV